KGRRLVNGAHEGWPLVASQLIRAHGYAWDTSSCVTALHRLPLCAAWNRHVEVVHADDLERILLSILFGVSFRRRENPVPPHGAAADHEALIVAHTSDSRAA